MPQWIFPCLFWAGGITAVCLGFWLAPRMFEGKVAQFFGGCFLSLLGLILVTAIVFAGCIMATSKN